MLDGVFGGVVCPSIVERTLIFAPLHGLALLFSSAPTRAIMQQMLGGESSMEPEAIVEAVRAIASLQAVSLFILLISAVLQTVLHTSRRRRWLCSELANRAAVNARSVAKSKPALEDDERKSPNSSFTRYSGCNQPVINLQSTFIFWKTW